MTGIIFGTIIFSMIGIGLLVFLNISFLILNGWSDPYQIRIIGAISFAIGVVLIPTYIQVLNQIKSEAKKQ